MFASMDVGLYELQGDVRQLKAESREDRRKLQLTGGDIRGEFAFRGSEEEIRIDGEDAVEFSDGQMLFIDFGFQPTENLEGQFSVNILGNVAEKRPLEFTYGDRGLPLTIEADQLVGEDFEDRKVTFDDRERIEIYDFSATYRGELFDAEAFYHTPRYHWGYEGDFFGLVREATDIARDGRLEFEGPGGHRDPGKGNLDGLTLLGARGLLGREPEGRRQVRLRARQGRPELHPLGGRRAARRGRRGDPGDGAAVAPDDALRQDRAVQGRQARGGRHHVGHREGGRDLHPRG
jgi:beta-galactosidase